MRPKRRMLALALIALAGCGSLMQDPNKVPARPGPVGSSAIVGDGGVVVPALGAATGPIISAEAAENNPIFRDAILQ